MGAVTYPILLPLIPLVMPDSPVPLPMRLSVLPAVTLLSTSGSLPLEDDKVLPATMASTKVSEVCGPVSAPWKGLNRRGSA